MSDTVCLKGLMRSHARKIGYAMHVGLLVRVAATESALATVSPFAHGTNGIIGLFRKVVGDTHADTHGSILAEVH